MSIFNIIFVGILYRIIILIILIFFPLYHEIYGYVSPLSYYNSLSDLQLHKDIIYLFKVNECGNIYFLQFYKDLFALIFNSDNNFFLSNDNCSKLFPGPFFGIILLITNYNENNVIILAGFIFIIEIVNLIIWVNIFKKKINNLYVLFYVFLPIPLCFAFMHIPDIFAFTAFSLLSFLIYNKYNNFLMITSFFLGILSHPLFFIVFFYLIFELKEKKINLSKLQIYLLYILFFISTIYYLEYFTVDILKNSGLNNITDKDNNFNFIFIFIITTLKKILYILGYQESLSNNFFIIIGKYFCGIFYLIGFIYALFNLRHATNKMIIFYILCIALFFAPNWRYILIVSPLLYLNSIFFIDYIYSKFFLRFKY